MCACKDFLIPEQLQNDTIALELLKSSDFEELYEVASDPLIWEQHPNPTRYQREVFEVYFRGALESQGAYLVKNALSGKVIGCSRYYDFNAVTCSVCIGYTFISRECWGKSINRSLKILMLDHAMQWVNTVEFHVGVNNIRSQKAMEKLGAVKTGVTDMSYYGEPPHTNIIYQVNQDVWKMLRVV